LRFGFALTLFLLCSSLAAPLNIPLELRSEEDVAKIILAARDHVFVLAPQLRSSVIANALRKVAVEGGVRVLILCDTGRLEERNGYIATLSKLQERKRPLEVRSLRGINNSTLVVDDTRMVIGPLVSERWTYGLEPTRLLLEPREASRQSKYFWTQWKRGKPWVFKVSNPTFSPSGGKDK
jgi:hypothetical protein